MIMEGDSTMRNHKEDRQGVQVIRRGLRILDRLAESKGGLGIIKLAEMSELPPSTVHRVLQTFLEEGYIAQDESKRYTLGLKILSLARGFLNNLDLRRVAEPYLRELRDRTGETAHLVVRDGDAVLCLENVESSSNMRVTLPVGGHNPLYCTAVGKVFLVDFTDQELSSFLAKAPVKEYTAKTLTSLAGLKKEVARVRRQGYAVDDEEYEVGVRCIGAAVKDFDKKTIAGVGISGPAARIGDRKISVFGGHVVAAARGLSSAISGEGRKP
jgi:DNA-binding IclR family transcriptional regulator